MIEAALARLKSAVPSVRTASKLVMVICKKWIPAGKSYEMTGVAHDLEESIFQHTWTKSDLGAVQLGIGSVIR